MIHRQRRRRLTAGAWARLNRTRPDPDGLTRVRTADLQRLLGAYERLLATGAEPTTQYDLLPPLHVSLQKHRLRKFDRANPERVYLAEWKRRNVRRASINRGFTTLEWILSPECASPPPPISRRDAAVAASVVQWLGTNGGLGFIKTCERKIAEARGEVVRRTVVLRRALALGQELS